MSKEKPKNKDITKEQQIDLVVAAVDHEFGKGTLLALDNIKTGINVADSISTGSIMLDHILGTGGIPKGRIIEIVGLEGGGKSSLALSIVAEANKLGKYAAYIDMEHAVNVEYAKKIGVVPDLIRFSQPQNGEAALNIVQACVESNAFDIIVLDSVAALVPQKEIDGEIGDSHVGLQARLMSQAMRKLSPLIKSSSCSAIFINQVRMKIGVVYGCLNHETLVNFDDGKSLAISKIVDEKIGGNVFCLNEKTGIIETKPIIDWHDNGIVKSKDDFIHIQTNSINGGGRFGITCTKNHKILTVDGWKTAKDISYNDRLYSRYNKTITDTYKDFLYGCLIGDSYISTTAKNKNSACIKLQDNSNKKYVNWKIQKLSKFLTFHTIICNKKTIYQSQFLYEFIKIKKILFKRDPMFMLNDYSDLGLAIWIMDDGCFDNKGGYKRYAISVKRFKNNVPKLLEIVNKLTSLGLTCKFNNKDGCIHFNVDSTIIIADRIHKYIPDCMQYKLPLEYQNKYEEFELSNNQKLELEEVEIKEIRYASARQMRNRRKFDLSIEDNNNYFVGGIHNGVIVHNSPETSPGGLALKFYSDIRMDVRKISQLIESERPIGQNVRVKIIKNKLASPFKVCEFALIFEQGGIAKEDELINIGLEYGLLTKSGAWFKHKDTGKLIGPGRPKARKLLRENRELYNTLREKCISILNKPIENQPTDKTENTENAEVQSADEE